MFYGTVTSVFFPEFPFISCLFVLLDFFLNNFLNLLLDIMNSVSLKVTQSFVIHLPFVSIFYVFRNCEA